MAKNEPKKAKLGTSLRESTSFWVSTSFKESLKHNFFNCFLLFVSEMKKKGANIEKSLKTANLAFRCK